MLIVQGRQNSLPIYFHEQEKCHYISRKFMNNIFPFEWLNYVINDQNNA